MPTTDAVNTYRPLLLSIAYRMTGEVMTSEDIVQDTLTNWLSRSPDSVQDPKAYLAKSVMNASLNHLSAVKRQREAYKGTWLPEPISWPHPVLDAKLDISYGFLLLLEKLSPLERAIFLLKESFELDYTELADQFDITEANCRQLYHRAKEKIASSTRRFTIDPHHQQTLLDAFSQASTTGDIDSFMQLLKTDVVLYSDGGGKVRTAINPLFGRMVVERYLRSMVEKRGAELTVRTALINGSIAFLFSDQDTQLVTTVMVLDIDEQGIGHIFSLRNPDKLAHLQKN
ncbi:MULTISPECIES: sigma-70 family RNA polymerase sigma factor [unclassified Spirosoma]|uniref:sigma-70 family RNA polymerase sigma factor n=1 Tax=unclassified Spirosoma TaxID=2621999 RepID=UPI0009671A5C|nr:MULTISPECIES: sigma-70 family RNA polymerase sigma factor [unclassified Spirosoma]MBN8821567.1 sigma-70 family RNA polymerase sigma factor [Spirosoma sp.]OJW78341.1 MAG: RNA polymerase subunit sigma-70 [Spirosoma sp. 48-14]